MKRRITIEVDDQIFPSAVRQPELRREAERHFGLLIGRVEFDFQRGFAVEDLLKHGVTLIMDEQL